jgi:8-oxo-dGTP pyrophosphatase MutT (NUDIX family)
VDIPEFGTKREGEERRDGGCGVVFDPITQLYAVGRRLADSQLLLFSGGVDAGEDLEMGVLREVREESGLHDFQYVEKIAEALTHYFNRNKKVYRAAHATAFLVVLKSTDLVPTQLEEHEKFALVWRSAQEIRESWVADNHDDGYGHWIYFLDKAVLRAKELGYDTVSR